MLSVLLILIAFSVLALVLGYARGSAYVARVVVVLGSGVALVTHLAVEGLQGGGTAGAAVDWPSLLWWLGGPVYRSDTLAAGLGAWCLLLGGLCLLAGDRQEDSAGRGAVPQPVASLLAVATLYSLVYTSDLRAFATQMLLLLALLWAANGVAQSRVDSAGADPGDRRSAYSIGLGLGGLCILAAVLVMGQITGGGYGLAEISLSALARLPLSLIAVGIALWLGLAPITGWSAWGYRTGRNTAMAQSLALGVPIATLLLRLQALLTAQGPVGPAPVEWAGFQSALAWAGGLTALAAGAGTILTAGGPRWTALLTAHTLGMMTWALALDSPVGRQAALAILLAFGAARVTLEIAAVGGSLYATLAAGFSLAAAPLTAGFVGVWLLAGALALPARPSLAIALLGAVILTACGTALHLGSQRSTENNRLPAGPGGAAGWAAIAGTLGLVVGGVAPGLWLPQVASMASVAGSSAGVALPWTGISAGAGLLAPLPLLALGALVLAGGGWLVSAWMRSRTTYAGVLLPTAISRLEATRQHTPVGSHPILNPEPGSQNVAVPAPVWWLSLAWLEEGLWGFGSILARLGARAGLGLGRLEGRYQVPLALVLILVALLAAIR